MTKVGTSKRAEEHGWAKRVTAFVPITLKFEAEGKQINEVFSWDPNQSETNITKFAVTFATEAGLSQRYQTIVEQEIKRQIKLCKGVAERNEIRSEDSLLLLRLDLRWKSIEIIDQFVWDLANEYSDPDEFAAGMCKDLSIGSELAPVIAHAIRSEIFEYHKEYNDELERLKSRGDPSAKVFAMTKKGTCKYVNDKQFSRTGIVRKKQDLDTWSPVVTFLTEERGKQNEAEGKSNG